MNIHQAHGKSLPLENPLIMGILNVTPDSFSDGGQFHSVDQVVARAFEMIEQGADILDIGGESTGPGSKDVSEDEELDRVIPVLQALMPALNERGYRNESKRVVLSVDTYKAEVARQALELGADMINDVTAFRGDVDSGGHSKMAYVLAKYPDVQVVIMYSKDSTARTTREIVHYDNVVATVRDFLEERVQYGVSQGISRERFILDPGMGAFISGDPKYSLQILKSLREFEDLGLPILIGASRKGFIGQVLGEIAGKGPVPVSERLEGSLACAAIAMQNGASILRVHDVKETKRFVEMFDSIWNVGV